jgi:hypothetical protein
VLAAGQTKIAADANPAIEATTDFSAMARMLFSPASERFVRTISQDAAAVRMSCSIEHLEVEMKALPMLLGTAALAAGLLFVGQGLGYIRWPASSFMISQTRWVYYGGGIALCGLVLIVIGWGRSGR